MLLLICCLCTSQCLWGFCVCLFGMHYFVSFLVYNHLEDEEPAGCFAFVVLPSECLVTVYVLWLFLTVPWVGLQCVIGVFPDHTHLLFFIQLQTFKNTHSYSLYIHVFTPDCIYTYLLQIVYTHIYSGLYIHVFTPDCIYTYLLRIVYTLILLQIVYTHILLQVVYTHILLQIVYTRIYSRLYIHIFYSRLYIHVFYSRLYIHVFTPDCIYTYFTPDCKHILKKVRKVCCIL